MTDTTNFCGASGASYKFERIGMSEDWVRMAGVVLFAAPEGRGWRIISVGDQGGVDGDIRAFWRWREARRYGATAVFMHRNADFAVRRRECADLVAGLEPVCMPGAEAEPLAA
jgi:hypothetical protein